MEAPNLSVILHLLNYVALLVCMKNSPQEVNTTDFILKVHVIGVFRTNNSHGFMEAMKLVKKELRKNTCFRLKGAVVQQGVEDITTVARAVCKKISKRGVIAVVSDQRSKSLQLMAYIMGQQMIPILGLSSQEVMLSRKVCRVFKIKWSHY